MNLMVTKIILEAFTNANIFCRTHAKNFDGRGGFLCQFQQFYWLFGVLQKTQLLVKACITKHEYAYILIHN